VGAKSGWRWKKNMRESSSEEENEEVKQVLL
jgi:hypothetical protein